MTIKITIQLEHPIGERFKHATLREDSLRATPNGEPHAVMFRQSTFPEQKDEKWAKVKEASTVLADALQEILKEYNVEITGEEEKNNDQD